MVEKKLKELCDINYGKDHKAVNDPSGAYPILGTGGLMGFAREKLFDGPSVLIGRKGSINKPQFASSPFWTVDTLYYTSNFKNAIPKWLYYYLSFIDLMRYNEATGLPSLNRNTLYHISVLTPPLPEQKKIAAILSTVDEAIQKVKAQIERTKELKKGLMQKLFSEGIGHTEFKESKLGRIPKEWEVVRIKDIGRVIDSLHQTPKFSDEGYPMVRVGDINKSKLDLDNCLTVPKDVFEIFTKNHIPTKGDVLITRVGSFGKTILVENDSLFCLGQNTAVITGLSNERYVYFALNSYSILKQIKVLTNGSTQPSLSLKEIRNIKIAVGSKTEQQKISEILSIADAKIEKKVQERAQLEQLKKGLMQKLLTGEVRVKVNE